MSDVSKEEIAKFRIICEKFCEKNDFQLNPDVEHADMAMEGALEQEKLKGLKYCPCRLQTGEFDKDLELLCPCNFKIQDTWKEKGMCWCGLFVKK